MGVSEEDLLRDIELFLDPDGFRWFAALAVFPALQWDITLFLGLRLPSSGSPDRRCYSDDAAGDRRISALTRLPWLASGRMPLWLREALIKRLPQDDKRVIYEALDLALEEAEAEQDAPAELDRQVRIKIGREPSRAARLLRRLPDELLLKFMRRGDKGDYQVSKGSRTAFRSRQSAFCVRAAISGWRRSACSPPPPLGCGAFSDCSAGHWGVVAANAGGGGLGPRLLLELLQDRFSDQRRFGPRLTLSWLWRTASPRSDARPASPFAALYAHWRRSPIRWQMDRAGRRWS